MWQPHFLLLPVVVFNIVMHAPPGTFEMCAPPWPFEMHAPPGTFEMYAPPGTFEMYAPPGPFEMYAPPGTFEMYAPPGPFEMYAPPGTFEMGAPCTFLCILTDINNVMFYSNPFTEHTRHWPEECPPMYNSAMNID
jgi:hypothetical protein